MFDPQSDYRLDGRETVIACAKDGEVRGYLPAEGQEMTMGGGKDESMMKELQERKQEYMQQLRQPTLGDYSISPVGRGETSPMLPVPLHIS